MNKQILPTAAVLALVSGGASAGVVTHTLTPVATVIQVAKQGNSEPTGTLGINLGVHGPISNTGGIGGPYSFNVTHSGELHFYVTDSGQVGDVYQVFLSATPGGNPVSVGDTSNEPVALGIAVHPPTLSSGEFSEAVTPGTYKYNVADVTMQYIGSPWPFGIFHTYTGANNPTADALCNCTLAGSVPANFSPSPHYAPFFVSATETYQAITTPAVPEPASLSILGSGLIAAGLLRRRRARKS